MDAAETAIARHIRRIVGQGVLVADVMRHLFADRVHIFHVFREISHAAGSLRNFGQRALRAVFALFLLSWLSNPMV